MKERHANRHWDEAPVLLDVIREDGTILYANRTETEALGMPAGSLDGARFEAAYAPPSRQIIESCFERARRGEQVSESCLSLPMLSKRRGQLEMAGTVASAIDAQDGLVLRVAKLRSAPVLERLKRLESDNEVMSSIIDTARDATYCIDFTEPVDLTAPEHEIIRQVFENACRWRYCNPGMARIYRLPPGEDLNTRDVSEVFPRNAENERFVRQLIACNWHVNGAPSHDHRYDGLDLNVENDVRATIVEGRLLRFWGIVRDSSSDKLKEIQLKTEANQALDLLAAVPDPILVVSANGRVEGANPAVDWWLGWSMDELLGKRLEQVLSFDANVLGLISAAGSGKDALRRRATAICSDGSRIASDVSIASINAEGARGRVVVMLRPVPAAGKAAAKQIAHGDRP